MKRQHETGLTLPVVASVTETVNLSKTAIGGRISAARRAVGLTQEALANLAGAKSKSGLQDNEAGKNMPGGQMIGALISAGINANWLLTGEGSMLLRDMATPDANNAHHQGAITLGYVSVPLYNDIRAAAGHGSVVEHEVPDDALMFKEEWIRFELGANPADLCLIRVSGDSMEPTLRAGDVILVDHRASRPDREGIYILRMGDMLLVKRLQAMPGGKVKVISDNAAFDSWTLNLSDIGNDVVIIGRVVWSGRRH